MWRFHSSPIRSSLESPIPHILNLNRENGCVRRQRITIWRRIILQWCDIVCHVTTDRARHSTYNMLRYKITYTVTPIQITLQRVLMCTTISHRIASAYLGSYHAMPYLAMLCGSLFAPGREAPVLRTPAPSGVLGDRVSTLAPGSRAAQNGSRQHTSNATERTRRIEGFEETKADTQKHPCMGMT